MKRVTKFICLLGIALLSMNVASAQSQANAIDKYFKKYVDNEDFTVVYISGKMFELIGRLDIDAKTLDLDDDEDAEAIMDIARDMKRLRILTTEVNAESYYKEAKQMISTKEYEVLMTVRTTDGDNVEFLVLEDPNSSKIAELLLLSGGDDFVLLSFVGNLDLDKISRQHHEVGFVGGQILTYGADELTGLVVPTVQIRELREAVAGKCLRHRAARKGQRCAPNSVFQSFLACDDN